MEFVVKIRTSDGEQKKFKLISFTHLQFIVSQYSAVVNLKFSSQNSEISGDFSREKMSPQKIMKISEFKNL